jgi:tRNA dimethylallyltransferase
MKNLVVIVGPTGVGKTELCLQIAEHYDTPIINADSRQIFAELPIGTAAPTPEQMQRVKHYFVGNHHIKDYYSAAMYESDVLSLLEKLFFTHDVVLLSGGSMMYVDAVCKGIDDIPTVDKATRELYKQRLNTEGLPILLEELKRLDPEHYNIVDKQNPRRVVHALEICHMTGKTYTSFRTNTIKKRPFNIIKIGLNRPREELYERINQRVLHMMELGLEAEARQLYPMKGLNSLNTVGYKEMFKYIEGAIPREEAIRQIQSNTRQYMRKQLTWFKKDNTIQWFSPNNIEDILNCIDKNIL